MMRVLAGLMLTALLLTGCGGDEAEADIRRFCELIEQYNKGTGFEAPPADTPQDQQEAALTKAMRDYLSLPEIKTILDELGEVAPPEIDAEVDTMREAADELVETGENSFMEPEAIEANDKIKAYTDSACAPEETEGPTGGEPADEAPADGAPAEEPPADEAPADEAPADEAPAEETPAGETATES